MQRDYPEQKRPDQGQPQKRPNQQPGQNPADRQKKRDEDNE